MDSIDNGTPSNNGGQTSYSSPGWLDTLNSAVTTGTNIAGSVMPIVNGQPSGSPSGTAGNPVSKPPGTPPPQVPAGMKMGNSKLWWIIGGAVAIGGAVLFFIFRKKK